MQKPVVELVADDGLLNPHELELAQLIVSTLNLDRQAADIDPNAPLYKDGLGLDSIDVLEIALAVSKIYGIRLRSDDGNNQKIFRSLRDLSRHIQQFRAK
jgi:acyl carrier protein